MPSSSEHKAKADRNRLFLSGIRGNAGDGDWVAIVVFYEAMHLVERLSACANLHHASHPARLVWVQRTHRRIYVAFSTLYDAAQTARYGIVNQFARAYPGNDVEAILVNQHLAAIETYVAGHFPAPPSTPPPTAPTAGP